MAEQHGHHHHHHDHHHHHHHDHHHDYAKANADHFSDHSASYVTELSTELARRCALAIVKKYPFDPARTEVLDFACGPGLISFQLLPHAKRIVGADLAPGMVAVYNKTVRLTWRDSRERYFFHRSRKRDSRRRSCTASKLICSKETRRS